MRLRHHKTPMGSGGIFKGVFSFLYFFLNHQQGLHLRLSIT